MATELATWLLAAALHFAPPETRPQFPGYEESRTETISRYESIVSDIERAAEGDKSRATLLLALAIGETGLSLDTDRGPCYRGGAYKSRCDGGTSATLWQLKSVRWKGEVLRYLDLFKDRLRAATIALSIARKSIGMCRHLEPQDQLSAYGSGACRPGLKSVRARYHLWARINAWTPLKSRG